MASVAQIKAIHTLKSKLHLDDETYRGNLSKYGVQSAKDISFSTLDASEFLRDLSLIAEKFGIANPSSSKKYFGTGRRGYQRHLTASQADRISILEKILDWDANQTNGFIFKQTGEQKAVQMLMNYEAGKVIIGMQRILAAGDKEDYLAFNKMSNTELKKLGAPKF